MAQPMRSGKVFDPESAKLAISKRKSKKGEPLGQYLTPTIKSEMATDMMQLYGFDAAQTISNHMKSLEDLYQSKKDELSFKEHMDYYKTILATAERMVAYQYARKAIEHKSQKVDVKIDYNNMIDLLNKKTFGDGEYTPQYIRDINKSVKDIEIIEDNVVKDNQDIDQDIGG